MPFCRLILPVDGSPASNRGVAFAAQLAKSEGATVYVCSAVDEAATVLPVAEGSALNPAPLFEGMETLAQQQVSAALDVLRDAGVTALGSIVYGNPVAEVALFARREHADGIVLGTNGRTGIERIFMGSVTAALLRIADVPVVTVHADDVMRSGPAIVAIDSSMASLAALECALERARVTGAAVRLLHVFEERRVDRLCSAMGLRPQTARRQALTDADIALDDAADRARAAGVKFCTELERGDPVESILMSAERYGACAIAIGTHGRGALERFTIGSVSDGVVRNAHVPVYVVHRRSAKISEQREVERRRVSQDYAALEGVGVWQHRS